MNNIFYKGISRIIGPLIVLEGIEKVMYGELVEISIGDESRIGQVLEISGNNAVIEVLRGTSGIEMGRTKARFTGSTMKVKVSEDMLGRTLNGLGEPIDYGPNVTSGQDMDVNGFPINPSVRSPPRDFIQTGISAVDGLMSIVRGQKLPIFSGYGLPHNIFGSQIVRQAKLMRSDESFAVVFAAIGISNEEAEFFKLEFEKAQIMLRTVFILNLSSDPTMERIVTPRTALTIAEHLAFEKGYHVLVIVDDMTNYCEALRELGLARGEIPGRRGYPGYMYSDLAMTYERAGMIYGIKGSITLLPILTMPDDDITHPIPDLTGYITEGQIVLSRSLHTAGIYPPVDPLLSLSRLMKDGVGEGMTRNDHYEVYRSLLEAYAQGRRSSDLAMVMGEEALTSEERKYVTFSKLLETKFINQGRYQNREIDDTLNIGQEALSVLK